jgi:hypothetical protein
MRPVGSRISRETHYDAQQHRNTSTAQSAEEGSLDADVPT